jgi:hypothetical protein
MYHLYGADGSEVDPREEKNIANPAVIGYTANKKLELSQLLAQVEAERLRPPSYLFLPLVQH